MSRADKIFIENLKDIIENGFSDEKLEVRPHWEDGTPAHTTKKFCIVNRYNLAEEFPIITVRKTNFKACLDEILWIRQKKSNRSRDVRQR
jgi:thymidylate synthase